MDISGKGHLGKKGSNEAVAVNYRLSGIQRMAPTGMGLPPVPGMIRINGIIVTKVNDPMILTEWFASRETFTLLLEDGRKLDLVFSNNRGSVTASGEGLYS